MPFRFHAKKVGLTYSQSALTSAHILDTANTWGTLVKYTVGTEAHQDGGTHFHCFFVYNDKLDTTDARFFDIDGEHPNIIKAPKKGWEDYCVKDGDFVTNYYKQCPFVYAARGDVTVDEACEHLWSKRPRDMMIHGDAIESRIRKRKAVPKGAPAFFGPWPKAWMEAVADWNRDTHALVIIGEPGLGKTQFAKFLLGSFTMIKGGVNSLKRWNGVGSLLFDDVYMDQELQLSRDISDVMEGSDIRVLYGMVHIPPGTHRIFTANRDPLFPDPSIQERRAFYVNL